MPWWREIDGELVGAENIHGPFGAWVLTESTPPSGAEGGWAKYPNETAARAAIGTPRRVKGQDRFHLDNAISVVTGANLRQALIDLRNDDPDPESVTPSQTGKP
jgi:hypothetical protein